MITSAKKEDAAEIAQLWNEYVASTTATFRNALYETHEIEALIAQLAKDDHAFLVARNETLLGFALYKQFRGGDGYRHTMEHSIYLAPSARGRGVGRKFMEALERHARFRNVHSFIGGITANNEESILFHERLGFRREGVVPQAGYKFEKWHDLAFMQKIFES